jgi:hypothetical protein
MLFGAFALPLYALCAAHLNDFVEEGGFVEASSGLLLLYAGGAVVGPIMASATMRGMGPGGLFVFTAAAHAAMAAFAVYRMTYGRRAPESTRGKFADALRMASAVSVVDTMAGTPGHEHPAGPSSPASQDFSPAEDAFTTPGAKAGSSAAHDGNIDEDDRQTERDHPIPKDR